MDSVMKLYGDVFVDSRLSSSKTTDPWYVYMIGAATYIVRGDLPYLDMDTKAAAGPFEAWPAAFDYVSEVRERERDVARIWGTVLAWLVILAAGAALVAFRGV